MAAALSPWPHREAATETRFRIRAKQTVYVHHKPRGHPCSVRLHGDLIQCHSPRGAVTITELDYRAEVADVATFTCLEACGKLIHAMLAEAPATSQYDVASGNLVDSVHTPLAIAEGIAKYVREELDDDEGVPVPGLEFDIHLDLLYSEVCAICLLDSDAVEDEVAVRLPCSHLFHHTCIATWFHQEPTCPTCRRGMPENFRFVRSASRQEFILIETVDGASQLQLSANQSEDEPFDVAGEDEN